MIVSPVAIQIGSLAYDAYGLRGSTASIKENFLETLNAQIQEAAHKKNLENGGVVPKAAAAAGVEA